MLFYAYLLSVGISSAMMIIKNYKSNTILEKRNYVFNEDKRDLTDQVLDFMKDYWYLFIPGYNLYKANKKRTEAILVYTGKRKEKLEKRGILTKKINKPEINNNKKEEVKKEETKVVKKEENKEVKSQNKNQVIDNNYNDFYYIDNELKFYIETDKKLHEELAKKDKEGCSITVHNEYVKMILEVQNKYNDLLKLKNVLKVNDSKKLVR